MNELTHLSGVMLQNIARLVAEGRHHSLPQEVLAAYEAQTGEKVTAPPSGPVAEECNREESSRARFQQNNPPLKMAGQPRGFVKLLRTTATEALLGDRNAFHLLTVIAYRARWTDDGGLDELKFGQALVGDHGRYGMSRKEYRTAAARLQRMGLASFVGTPQGTIATLTDSRVFSLRHERENEKSGHHKGQQEGQLFPEVKCRIRATAPAITEATEGPSRGHQGATNKKVSREEGKESNTVETVWADLPPVLQTDAFKSAWSDYTSYRKEAKLRPLKPRSVAAQWTELATWGESVAIERIRVTIRQGWSGIFPPSSATSSTPIRSTVPGANRHQMPAATGEDHAKGFFAGTEFEPRPGTLP